MSDNKDVAVIGLQTGDEGKGVRVAYLAQDAVRECTSLIEPGPSVLVMRWQGGANAGHTVKLGDKTYKLHQVPSGIVVAGTYNLMGEGVYFNPREGMREIKELQKTLPVHKGNFGISSNAHVTLDYHVMADRKDREKAHHTSTGRGIKPTAIDKAGRVGMRFMEFLDRDTFVEILKQERFTNSVPEGYRNVEEFADSYGEERDFLRGFAVLQADMLNSTTFETIIGEGAQGFRLDVDKGLYPGVTSSNPAIVPFKTDAILGVVKLYESSVGHDRPFVGQMEKGLESKMRDLWGERGTTTGLPRDLGWFDAVAVKHAVASCDVDHLVSTCGDRLEELGKIGEKVKVVVGYKIDGKTYHEWDMSFHNRRTLYRATPVFEEFEPWTKFSDSGEIDPNAQRFIDRIEELVDASFILHGTGPDVEDVIEVGQ